MQTQKPVRQSGVELLRIIAMYLIVTHHMVAHNGFDFWDNLHSGRGVVFGFFEYVPGKIGIALFFIASAWFLCEGKPSLRKSCRKIWVLERELLFWSFAGTGLQIALVSKELTLQQIVVTLFPAITQLWWYVTCYNLFLLFQPSLTMGLRGMGRRAHGQLAVVMVGLWGVAALVPFASLNIGLNVLGFVYVYVLVAYYRWYMRPMSGRTIAIAFLSSSMLLIVWNAVFEWLYTPERAVDYQTLLLLMDREWSLPVLVCSFSVFLFFDRLKFRSKVVNMVASWTLGVYLITDHPVMRELLWTKLFGFERFFFIPGALNAALAMFAIVTGVFVAALLLEACRQLLFRFSFDRHKGNWFDALWRRVSAKYTLFSDVASEMR